MLGFVDAMTELGGRLQRRGWTDVSSGADLAWDWPGTVLAEQVWTGGGPGGSNLLPCTSITAAADGEEVDQLAVEVTLVGELDAAGAGRPVRPERLTDEVLAELETHQAGEPSPPLLTGEPAR